MRFEEEKRTKRVVFLILLCLFALNLPIRPSYGYSRNPYISIGWTTTNSYGAKARTNYSLDKTLLLFSENLTGGIEILEVVLPDYVQIGPNQYTITRLYPGYLQFRLYDQNGASVLHNIKIDDEDGLTTSDSLYFNFYPWDVAPSYPGTKFSVRWTLIYQFQYYDGDSWHDLSSQIARDPLIINFVSYVNELSEFSNFAVIGICSSIFFVILKIKNPLKS